MEAMPFWQVWDRTENRLLPSDAWRYKNGVVTVTGCVPYHRYTASFLVWRIWEEINMYNHTIKGRPAEQCYNWILEQMSKHYVVPSFASRNQSNAQTYTMKYDQANDNYSITLTDTNNTLADINFSASGITVTRSGNQYTFTGL